MFSELKLANYKTVRQTSSAYKIGTQKDIKQKEWNLTYADESDLKGSVAQKLERKERKRG